MNEQDARKTLRYRWLIFWTMALAYVFVYFHRQCPAVVALDLQQAFQTSAGTLGLLASAYFYPYALLQLPAGLLSDSLGPRKTATIFLVIAAAGSILFGFASTVEIAVAARVMVGIGVAMVFIPTTKIVAQWFRAREFAFMMAILITMGGVGVYLATKPLAIFSGWAGWRASFEVIGLATLVLTILVWLIVRNRPQDMGWPSPAQIDHLEPEIASLPQQIPLLEGVRRVLTEPRFWPLAIWFFLVPGIFFSFAGLWAGPYLQHVYGMTKSQTGDILGTIALAMIVGSPLLSLLSDKALKSRKKVMILATSVLSAELVLLNLFPDSLSRAMLYVAVFIFCVCASAIVVIGFTATKELFPVEIAGTSVGTVNLFPFLGGAILQILLGAVLDGYPRNASGAYPLEAYSAVLSIMLGAAIVALVCTLFMKETFPGSPGRG